MNKHTLKVLMFAVLLGTLTVVGSAQGRGGPGWGQRPAGPPPDQRGGMPPDFGRGQGGPGGPSFEMFADNRLVKGAPYAATAVTETVQVLGDGTRITRKNSSNVYRDGEGRTRREQTIDRVGPFSVGDQARQMIFINDPVAGVSYSLDPQNKTANKMVRPERPGPGGPGFRPQGPQGPPPNGEMRPPNGEMRKSAAGNTDNRSVESLGKQMFEGVEADGTRVTITIPAGQMGNDRPLVTVMERWESAELQVVVYSKHKDPFAGETTYRLTDIKRAEPARTLFEAPADYNVQEGRPGFGGPGGPGGPPPGANMRRKQPGQ